MLTLIDRQLPPPNTSAKDRKANAMFNYFYERLDMPLPNRLVEEGFPCYYLVEQRHMHRTISDFPNRKIYGGKLRDGPGMDISLEEQMPGLPEVLRNIIMREFRQSANRERFTREKNDDDLRRFYIQVDGERFASEATGSMAVAEHVEVFFKKIFPDLQAYFKRTGKSMNKEVMIICAYNHQVYYYHSTT